MTVKSTAGYSNKFSCGKSIVFSVSKNVAFTAYYTPYFCMLMSVNCIRRTVKEKTALYKYFSTYSRKVNRKFKVFHNISSLDINIMKMAV